MANFNLSSFMSQQGDLARSYLFYFNVTNAAPMGWTDDDVYLVKSSQLPTSTIDIAEVNWQGNAYKLGTTQTFTEQNVTFSIEPNDQNLRNRFLKWIEGIHNIGDNHHGVPAKYMADLELRHVNQQNIDITTYKLIKAWPNTVSEVALDYANKATAEFNVTFVYQYHTVAEGAAPAAAV